MTPVQRCTRTAEHVISPKDAATTRWVMLNRSELANAAAAAISPPSASMWGMDCPWNSPKAISAGTWNQRSQTIAA